MKILYQAVVLHSPEDFGASKEAAIAALIRKYGKQKAEEYLAAIATLWEETKQRIKRAGLYQIENASRLHIFCDGLPIVPDDTALKIKTSEWTQRRIPMYCIASGLQRNGANRKYCKKRGGYG